MSDERDEVEAYRRALEEGTLEDLLAVVEEANNLTELTRLASSIADAESGRGAGACGWIVARDGFEEVIGVIGLPKEVVDAFGGVDVADDGITVQMLGSALHPTGVLARWEVYEPVALEVGVELETSDGARWPLRPGSDETERTVVLPATQAVPTPGAEGLFRVAFSAHATPSASHLVEELELVEVFVQLWASPPELAGVRASSDESVSHTIEVRLSQTDAAALGVRPAVEILLSSSEHDVVLRPLDPSRPPTLSVRLGSGSAVLMEPEGRELVARLPGGAPLVNVGLSIRRHDR